VLMLAENYVEDLPESRIFVHPARVLLLSCGLGIAQKRRGVTDRLTQQHQSSDERKKESL